jgi:general secretion pathway protein I
MTITTTRRFAACARAGFTLLEVMVAMAILGIAMLALLSLHHQSLQSVIHAQDITRAAMLAEAVMTQAELQRYPDPGKTQGNFDQLFPGQYPNFQWQQVVEESGIFPDVRKVRVIVFYGPRLDHAFGITEFLHNPGTENGETAGSSAGVEAMPTAGGNTGGVNTATGGVAPDEGAAGNDPFNTTKRRRGP